MIDAFEKISRFYRAAVPRSVRQLQWVSRPKDFVVRFLLRHDAVYNSAYYANVIEPSAAASSAPISKSICADLGARSAVDVGCGTGALLDALKSRGCDVFGYEYSAAAIRFCRARGVEVQKLDIERGTAAQERTFDVAISMEVAEHLPAAVAGRLIALLARLSDVIVFTAAHPGQGGVDHVNEQPKSYWVERFESAGFLSDEALAQQWSESWRRGGCVASWYFENLMVFRRKDEGRSILVGEAALQRRVQ